MFGTTHASMHSDANSRAAVGAISKNHPVSRMALALLALLLCASMAATASLTAWADEAEPEYIATAKPAEDALFMPDDPDADPNVLTATAPSVEPTPGVFDPLAGLEVDPAAEVFPVALTVIDATEGNAVIYNVMIEGMTSQNTVADLLQAAGMTEVATLEETKDNPQAYFLQYDSPYFMGKGFNVATEDFWTTMFEGSGENWENAMVYASLVPYGHYQYVYGTAYAFAYDSDEAGAVMGAPLLDAQAETDAGEEGGVHPMLVVVLACAVIGVACAFFVRSKKRGDVR